MLTSGGRMTVASRGESRQWRSRTTVPILDHVGLEQNRCIILGTTIIFGGPIVASNGIFAKTSDGLFKSKHFNEYTYTKQMHHKEQGEFAKDCSN